MMNTPACMFTLEFMHRNVLYWLLTWPAGTSQASVCYLFLAKEISGIKSGGQDTLGHFAVQRKGKHRGASKPESYPFVSWSTGALSQ